jgi:hypothetical protein
MPRGSVNMDNGSGGGDSGHRVTVWRTFLSGFSRGAEKVASGPKKYNQRS